MSLRQAQSKFAVMAANLILRARDMGYEVTLGDAFRDPRVFGDVGIPMGYGHSKSCHKLRLALDLNLFIGGVFKTDTESHRPLGEWWEQQGGTWGGRFTNPDANHYSISWEGMR